MTQLEAIAAMTGQLTMAHPEEAMPAPMTPPTMECVVETGAPSQVAMFSQMAAPSRAPVMTQTKTLASPMVSGSMMPFLTVLTTLPPAMIAPAASNVAAMTMAVVNVIASEPTAGPTLLATSLAPMLIAMYAPMTAATTSR